MSGSFRTYLRAQAERQDAVGDFARDALADPDFPTVQSVDDLRAYLEDRGAIEAAIKAGERAYAEYLNAGNRSDS